MEYRLTRYEKLPLFCVGDVQCFGYDCYPLAFGVPAILMVVSVCFFVAGTSLYKRNPPEGNVVVDVTKAVCVSIFKYCLIFTKRKPFSRQAFLILSR